MYISIESYEEMYLKEKDEKALELEVEKIRREIAKAKERLESPLYVYDTLAVPSEADTIEVYRSYLSTAINALSAYRGADALTEEEKAAALVDSMTENITCVTLTVGRYLQSKYELELSSASARLTETHLGKEQVVRQLQRDDVLAAIKALHIGEWKESYTPEQYGCTLNEPTKWQLRIDYIRGAAPRFYDGIGIFPYNFNSLVKILGADIA